METVPLKRNSLTLEIIKERTMTDAEIETIASILFAWWKRDFESKRDEYNESELTSND
jgi:hypothetical protein